MGKNDPVPGTLNFRAVFSFAAKGGRVKPAQIYRSGAFDDIGLEGLRAMQALDVITSFDLRSESEKLRRPSPLLDQEGFSVVSEPHDIRSGDLSALLAEPSATVQEAADVMRAIYARLPDEFSAVYQRYFRTLLATERPIAVHCTAGKDRTGVVIAILLDLLGVARDDIFDDYLATNAVRDALRVRLRSRNQGVDFGDVRHDLLEPVIACNASYLSAMFATLDQKYNGAQSYVVNVLALSDADIEQLRATLLV